MSNKIAPFLIIKTNPSHLGNVEISIKKTNRFWRWNLFSFCFWIPHFLRFVKRWFLTARWWLGVSLSNMPLRTGCSVWLLFFVSFTRLLNASGHIQQTVAINSWKISNFFNNVRKKFKIFKKWGIFISIWKSSVI